MATNILIIEAYTDANIGSGALVENALRVITDLERGEKCNLRVMAHYPKAFSMRYSIDAVQDIFNYPFNEPRVRQYLWLIGTVTWMLGAWLFPLRALKRRRWADFAWADIVVSVGAERINDKYIKNEFFSLFTYGIVKKMGKTMVIFPSTIGPFIYHTTRSISAWILGRVDLVYTRDEQSYREVLSFKTVAPDKVINTSDVAICQEFTPGATALLPRPTKKPIVGVSALKWIYVANTHETIYSNYDAYKHEMARLVDNIIQQYDADVILYPTNFPVNGCKANDVEVAKEIYGLTIPKHRVSIIEDLPSPSEFKSMLSCSQVNIATRMHACILSTGACVPTMSINYLFKVKEYMQSVGLGDYTIDIEEFNSNDAMRIFQRVWDNRIALRQQLIKTMEEKRTELPHKMGVFNSLIR